MFDIKNIPILSKFILVIAVFGVMSVASLVYSTRAMRHISSGFSTVIEQQGTGSLNVSRSSRYLNQAALAIADLILATTDAGNHLAMDDLKTARAGFIEDMTTAKSLLPDQAQAIDDILDRGRTTIDQTCAKAIQLGDSTGPNAVSIASTDFLENCRPAFRPITEAMKKLVLEARATLNELDNDLTERTTMTVTVTVTSVAVLGGLAFVVLLAWLAVSIWISRPLQSIALTMKSLADGDLAVAVDGTQRRDEIGQMARAVQVFKENGIKLRETEADGARQRAIAEKERAANESLRAEVQLRQQTVVAAIANGLELLSKGDLTGCLTMIFAEEYEKLRSDFNATAASLHETLRTITVARKASARARIRLHIRPMTCHAARNNRPQASKRRPPRSTLSPRR